MIRAFSALLLAASLHSCVTYEFEHEFWLKTDGSGSFVVTAPPWVWNSVKNVGDSRQVDATVTETTVADLFRNPAFSAVRSTTLNRSGRRFITVSADFTDVNALIGTRAFPDLAIALQREGERLHLFGVWRRPPSSGTGQGDATGLMAVRFHLPSKIFDHRLASMGVEGGNILSWKQELSAGIAGAPLDFGATLGTTRVLRATPGLFGFAALSAFGVMGAVLLFFLNRHSNHKLRRMRHPGARHGSNGDSDFLNYDPTSVGP